VIDCEAGVGVSAAGVSVSQLTAVFASNLDARLNTIPPATFTTSLQENPQRNAILFVIHNKEYLTWQIG
jgi:hypothetical protein